MGENPGFIPFNSFAKYLLSTCCTPDTLLGAGNAIMNKAGRNHRPRGTGFLVLCVRGSTRWRRASGAEVLTSALRLVVWLRWCLFAPSSSPHSALIVLLFSDQTHDSPLELPGVCRHLSGLPSACMKEKPLDVRSLRIPAYPPLRLLTPFIESDCILMS